MIAGPVGGIEQVQGWYRDRQSGLTPMRLDFLRTCLASSLANQPFGCTIDPTKEGLQRAATVGVAVQSNQIPIGKAAEEMVAALGMQRVEVFGTAGDTPLGYVMVEADRHMKQLALGIHPMPRGAVNYLDVIDASIDQGPPNELLLRLWFTSSPRSVRADSERKVFELAGTPIQLSGQNERAMAGGQRGNVIQDFRTDRFVAEFNQGLARYPIRVSNLRCFGIDLPNRFASRTDSAIRGRGHSSSARSAAGGNGKPKRLFAPHTAAGRIDCHLAYGASRTKASSRASGQRRREC